MIKLAIIGAGSVGFTQRLVTDLFTVPAFQNIEVALTDLSQHNLDLVSQIINKIIEVNKLAAKINTTLDRTIALKNADYVISCVRVGGLEAFETDINIPLKYGVDQCVGDTLCAGGLMYGQRNIAVYKEFCNDIKKYAKPDVLFINYANPMAMNTWACLDEGVNTVGLCHGVQHGAEQLYTALGVTHDQFEYECVGINHQTWYTSVKVDGKSVSQKTLLEAMRAHEIYKQTEKVRLDVFERFGLYSTESNGHLSEYLPWYRKRPEEIMRWIDLSDWINGETGGYLRHCSERRHWFETDFPKFLEEAAIPLTEYKRTEEHASYIIEAIETGKVYKGHFNVRNKGIILNLPKDAIVESVGYVDRFGIAMKAGFELPLAAAATCNRSIDVQRMSVTAAKTGDVLLLKQAFLHDPLIGAVCNPEEVWQMVDELLVAQAKWLPQYAHAIPAAIERLKHKTIKTKEWAGAARLEQKTT